jgi:sugar transferase (PEP-CTERM/EpsH1 system associated)
MPEVLFLCHRIPYPPDKGDKIRSWRIFKHLTERYKVHLACFIDDPRDWAHVDFLRAQCASAVFAPIRPHIAAAKSARGLLAGEPLSVAYFRNPIMEKAVAQMRVRPLAAEIAFSSTMAQYIERAAPGRPRIIDFCDADSEKWRQYAQSAPPPMRWIYAREGALLARAETEIASWADASFAVTEEEAALFNRQNGAKRKVRHWRNGVDTDYFSPLAPIAEVNAGADLVFTGAMDYRANVDAALFLLDAVWPRIRKAAPEARLAIVGARPVKSLRRRNGDRGVIVTGRVNDVRPWLRQAKAAIAPLRVARGVQNKVLEAMAMGKPVVATSAAATGVDAPPGEALMITDSAEDMAQAVLSLFKDEAARARMGLAARAAMLDGYCWRNCLAPFDAALRELINDRFAATPLAASL